MGSPRTYSKVITEKRTAPNSKSDSESEESPDSERTKMSSSGSSHRVPHSYSVPKGNGGKVVMEFVDKVYDQAPGFPDIFDEESFYMFAAVFTLVSCLAAFLASRYITLKSKD